MLLLQDRQSDTQKLRVHYWFSKSISQTSTKYHASVSTAWCNYGKISLCQILFLGSTKVQHSLYEAAFQCLLSRIVVMYRVT